MTGARYVVAIRAASRAVSKQSDGERGATIGTGASPFRPNIACSRSACSVLVGMPVEGPPRCTSMMISGSSRDTPRPIVSAFSASPGPDVEVTASAPPYEAPSAAPTARDLVFCLEGPHAEALVLGQLVQDVRGRRDRVGPQEQRQPAALRRRHQAVGQCEVAGDVAVAPRGQAGRLHLVGHREVLGGLAERPARLERREVGLEDLRVPGELGLEELRGALGRAGCTATTAGPARTCSSPARPPSW